MEVFVFTLLLSVSSELYILVLLFTITQSHATDAHHIREIRLLDKGFQQGATSIVEKGLL